MSHTVVMVTTSYPRFAGDTVATFLEPIAQGVAARGHSVHVVAPWHPRIDRAAVDGRVQFHYFRYAPARFSVFGYAEGLRADVELRAAAYLAAPFAAVAGSLLARRVARRHGASVMHGHWVVPGGVIAAAASGGLPLAISLHGSDMYVAERHRLIGQAARWAFGRAGWVTACSDDLRQRAIGLGAPPDRSEVLPYGVDAERFSPDADAGGRLRALLGIAADAPLVFTAGRLVRKKGFEFLVDAAARLAADWPALRLVIAGAGDLDAELRQRADTLGVSERVTFAGDVAQDAIPDYLSAADLVVVPSVKDAAGNVDGLPNFLLEALVSGTPVVTTDVGGIGAVAKDGRTASVVPPADGAAIAGAVGALLQNPDLGSRLGATARAQLSSESSWEKVAERFEAIYDQLASGSGC
ncbi:MAG: glycosyltransferase [Vicinamibacterales bacterium]|jgi:glycosyltransferase involved in cell wall biosynthesis|nr:glycosyl transferase family 1 [Acidobacteriota bacterium]MDP6373149.1 glycosyltransferase [Vicinamibacterales bacterium]MDP6609634.1 glycosyltransferase [Vicinamibacterales bacterium]HAK56472.1 glycosyltransferase family 4 protein [Acidobacteriota bacterium]|tara:strand:- start:3155 stop:4387 length:1233 start_codon:yes stop_codon:yes gene_type:complete